MSQDKGSSSFLILENMFQTPLFDKLVNILSKEAKESFTYDDRTEVLVKKNKTVLKGCVSMTVARGEGVQNYLNIVDIICELPQPYINSTLFSK